MILLSLYNGFRFVFEPITETGSNEYRGVYIQTESLEIVLAYAVTRFCRRLRVFLVFVHNPYLRMTIFPVAEYSPADRW